MMSQLSTISAPGVVAKRPRAWWRSVVLVIRGMRRDSRASRARRVLLMLIFLWMLNIFDLVFTMLAQKIGHFEELNPLARGLLGSPAMLVAFKLTMLSFATCVFFILRRRVLTEVACWCVTALYVALSVVWLRYYYAHSW